MKTMREKYFENYDRIEVPANNKRGFTVRYRYKADWHAWDLTASEFRRRKILLVMVEIVSILIYFWAALTKSAFNTVDLAAGFAMTSIIAWIAEMWGIFRFSTVSIPMTVNDFNEIKEFTTVGSGLRFVLLLLSTVSGLVLLARGGNLDSAAVLTAAGHAGTALCSLYICHIQGRLQWKLYRNVDGKVGTER